VVNNTKATNIRIILPTNSHDQTPQKNVSCSKTTETNVKNNNSEKHKIQPATKINTLVFNNQPNICHWEGQESCKHENCKV